jgi:gliding motility-associated-like protein
MGMFRSSILSLVFVVFVLSLHAQDVTMSNGTFQSCDGAFLDSGGGGAAYSNGEFFTATICPSTPGDVVTVDFQIFSLDQTGPNAAAWDYIEVYDGDNTGASYLGIYYGTDLQGLYVTGTPLNTSGCLTFVFRSNNDNQTGNFAATITCSTPCIRPVAVASDTAPLSRKICIGDEVTFSGQQSYAADGFNITEYLWDFADGTTATGPVVTHQFNFPGEYIVELFLTDDNGCASTNRVSLQLLVATPPSFDPFPPDTTLCLGESLVLQAFPNEYEVTWAGPEINFTNSESISLEDVVGESYPSVIEVGGFSPGQTLASEFDLLSIGMNIEHSWLYDLLITITCPSGQSVILHQQMTLPDGGTATGLGGDFGIGNTEAWDYAWSANATNETMAEEAQNQTSLPAGTYSSLFPLSGLVGCDLNGTWTLEITDLWGGDDGTLNQFSLNFNPAVIPDVTVFTPQIGTDGDSSFWTLPVGTYDLGYISSDGDELQVTPTEAGVLDFVYTTINDFGCTNSDTTVVTVEPPLPITAGPDQMFACETIDLIGGFANIPTPSCSEDAGTFNYCYGESENFVWTFCPDEIGDGVTMMSFSFISGMMEAFWENLIVYDGPDINSPILAEISGDATGLSWTATNETGCITIAFTSDFSNSCGSGQQQPWEYTVGCFQNTPQYEWSWTPAGSVTSSTTPETQINQLAEPTTFTLSAYPVGHPLCVTTDEVFIDVTAELEIETQTLYEICSGGEVQLEVPEVLAGIAPFEIEWTDPSGQTLPGDSPTVSVENPTEYCVTVTDACSFEETICVLVNVHPIIPATFRLDTLIGCEPLAIEFTTDYTAFQNISAMNWDFGDGDAGNTIGSAGHQYNRDGVYFPSLEIEDIFGCVYSHTSAVPVYVWDRPLSFFRVEPEKAILPNTTFQFTSLSNGATSYEWNFGGQGTSNAQDTLFTFTPGVVGEYFVYHIASNQYGCSDTSMKRIFVEEEIDVFIPNSFTPNGDGINDVWFVRGSGFQSEGYSLEIYNRWGEVVYTSTDPLQAWTGGRTGGELYLPDGAYLYRLKIRDKQNDVNHLYEGHIVLTR